MSETVAFTLDNHTIFELIHGQAGSLQKAILELVMNAIDAKATYVNVELAEDGKSFSVIDDGVGFRSRDEINAYFSKIGFDHSKLEEQRLYGRFGLGRLQVMAFAETNWKTHQFSMSVDVKRHGFGFDLVEHENSLWDGCAISGTFYEQQSNYSLNATVRELTDMTMYAQIPVYINGRAVNKPAKDQKWTHEDGDAYYQLKSNASTLTIYNLGVRVSTERASRFGVGGVVVTKKPLELNIARNDILVNKCEVFSRISEVLRQHSVAESKDKPKRLNNSRREALLNQWIAGDLEYAEVGALKLLPTMKAAVTLDRLIYSEWTVAPTVGDSVGEYLHRNGSFLVLSPVVLDWVNVPDGDALLDRLAQALATDAPYKEQMVRKRYTKYSAAIDGFSSEHKGIPIRDLKPSHKAVISAIEEMQFTLCSALHKVTGDSHSRRRINAGASDSAQAWTDGTQNIWFNIDELEAATKSLRGLFDLIPLTLHELCHDQPDSESHGHDQEFFERFHEAVFALNNPLAQSQLTRALVRRLRNAKQRVPAWLQRAASKGTLDTEIPQHFSDIEEGAA